jgi:hypothetical protein
LRAIHRKLFLKRISNFVVLTLFFLASIIFTSLMPVQKSDYAVSCPSYDELPASAMGTGGIQLTTSNVYVKLPVGSTLYSCGYTIYGSYVNFTSASLDSQSNPVHTFGLGSPNSNLTIESIAQNSVTLSTTCYSTYCYAWYYFVGARPPPVIAFSDGYPFIVDTG